MQLNNGERARAGCFCSSAGACRLVQQRLRGTRTHTRAHGMAHGHARVRPRCTHGRTETRRRTETDAAVGRARSAQTGTDCTERTAPRLHPTLCSHGRASGPTDSRDRARCLTCLSSLPLPSLCAGRTAVLLAPSTTPVTTTMRQSQVNLEQPKSKQFPTLLTSELGSNRTPAKKGSYYVLVVVVYLVTQGHTHKQHTIAVVYMVRVGGHARLGDPGCA